MVREGGAEQREKTRAGRAVEWAVGGATGGMLGTYHFKCVPFIRRDSTSLTFHAVYFLTS